MELKNEVDKIGHKNFIYPGTMIGTLEIFAYCGDNINNFNERKLIILKAKFL